MDYRLEFIFAKKGAMRFISHLDLMRLLMRALRRADLPLRLSEGFNPHPRVSLQRALKLGLESEEEVGSVILREFVKPEEFRTRFQAQLPEGILIRKVELKCQKRF